MDTMVDYLRAPTVGNGPYVFAEWQPGQFIRFTRNPKYWRTPYFDEAVLSIYPDANVNVRKAIEMGIDRQYIVDNLYDGKTEVPHSYWDGTAWNNPNTPFVGFDPDGAKALLRQAGWYDDTGDGVAKAHGVTGVADGTPLVLRAATLNSTDSSEYENTLLTVQASRALSGAASPATRSSA